MGKGKWEVGSGINFYNFLVMRKIGFILLSIALFSGCNNAGEKRVLVVTGGHAYDTLNFMEVFESSDDMVFDHLAQPDANSVYGSDSIDKYDAIIYYDMTQEITEDQKKAFLDMLNKGKGLVFLHHSIASYQDWDEFMKILGARYYLGPSVYNGDSVPPSNYSHDLDVDIQVIDGKHPITEGVMDFRIHDEVYDDVIVIPGVHPLLGTGHPNSMDVVAWTNEYGNSRIVYIQMGHDNNAYSNENFRKIVNQAIKWVAD